MSPQEVFETIARHLFTQGVQAKANTVCLYRGDNGTKCAVGCLIPDDMYNPDMEEMALYRIVENAKQSDIFRLPGYFFDDSVYHVLEAMQTVHDCDGNWESSGTLRAALFEASFYMKSDYNIIIDTAFINDLSFKDR